MNKKELKNCQNTFSNPSISGNTLHKKLEKTLGRKNYERINFIKITPDCFEKKENLEISEDLHNFDNLKVIYVWCNPLNKFLEFLNKNIRIYSSTAYHDAVKFFITWAILQGEVTFEKLQDSYKIDIEEKVVNIQGELEKNVKNVKNESTIINHEIKTAEIPDIISLKMKFSKFLRAIRDDKAIRDTWWFCFLRECKVINNRACFTFMGLIKINDELVTNIKKGDIDRRKIKNIVVKMVEEAERKLIEREKITKEELWNDSLYGVENRITQKLRQKLDLKDEIIQEKDNQIKEIVKEKDNQMKEIVKEKDNQMKEIIKEKDKRLEEKDKIINELLRQMKK